MGYSFFRSAFTAQYSAGGEFTLFIMHGKEGEAETMLNSYLGMVKEDSIAKKDSMYVVGDPYNGKVVLSKKGDYLVGAMNAVDVATSVEYTRKTTENISEK
jgi:hypothetical protein